MVRPRRRNDAQTEKEIEAFAAQAEQPLAAVTELTKAKAEPSTPPARTQAKAPAGTRSVSSADMADWKRRNREPKIGGINFRASSSQLDLLREAAIVEEISQQKVLERLVWPILEERYGSGQTAE